MNTEVLYLRDMLYYPEVCTYRILTFCSVFVFVGLKLFWPAQPLAGLWDVVEKRGTIGDSREADIVRVCRPDGNG